MTSYIREVFTLSAHQKPTVGDTKFSVVPTDHMGWLNCDGRSLSVSSYVFLYNVIGYSYGGSGATSTFNLPNPAGRVPAATGTGTDANASTFRVALGSTIGEYVHQLSIAEMPSHNHGVAGGGQISTNNSTSMVSTGITLNDPGHRHNYAAPNPTQPALGSGDRVSVDDRTLSTSVGFTGITLTDPTHSHVLNPAGGDRAHNNVQPTIGMGNMFIYSGKVNLGSFPYTTGTLLF
jgi:microcystin-dependent protein